MEQGKSMDVHVRKAHPSLYLSIMVVGIMGIALALNFWFSNPTFHPYGLSKHAVGAVFFLLGSSQLVFLNLVRNLKMVRLTLAISISWMLFWGASNAEQFFAGRASLQLPILYVALSIMQIPLLTESPVNPMTERK